MSDPDKLDILWAVPTRGLVRFEWHLAATRIENPMNTNVMQKFITDNTVEDARNLAVQSMFEEDAEYLWFLDDDVVAGPGTLARMLRQLEQKPEFSLITAIVPTKAEEPEPCIYRGSRPGAYWHWTAGEVFEIDQCGMACVLIRRDAFERLAEPWFTWQKWSSTDGRHEIGEDLGFCERLRKAGGRLLADGGSFCGHIDKDGTKYLFGEDIPPMKRGREWLKKQTPVGV